MRALARSKTKIFLLVVFALPALAGCFHSNGNDDDDDFGGNDGGGGGDDDDGGGATCDRVFAFGAGVAEWVQGSWTDATPDLFSSSWQIAGAAKIDCDEFILVGRDNATQSGLVLADVNHAFAQETSLSFSSDWEFTAVEAKKGTAIAVGGDWQNGKGLAMSRQGGTWSSINLPYVSANWWLTDVVLTGAEQGYAVGADMDRDAPVLLRIDKGVWSVEPSPGTGGGYVLYGIHLVDKDNGLAVGRNTELGKGAVVRLSGGTWYSATTPDISTDWDLSDVAMSNESFGILTGRGFDTNSGAALAYSDGLLTVLTFPFVSTDWSLSGVTTHSPDFLACGLDREHEEGIILRYTEDVWTMDARFPFELRGIREF